MLVVQGGRDTFGTPDEFQRVIAAVGPSLTLHVIQGGAHSFKVSRAGAAGQAAIDDDVRRTAGDWMRAVIRARGSASA